MTPKIVITRPAPQGRGFADALEVAFGGSLPIVLAPLMEIVSVPEERPVGLADHLIFTSANGVAQVGHLDLMPTAIAWCVGTKTADAAAVAGFSTRVADGDSAALVEMITKAQPQGRIVHLHGAHVTGSVVEQLQAAGLTCEGRVVYRQDPVGPSVALNDHLQGRDPLIVPLFSPRSARLLQAAGPIAAPLTLIVMSDAVARAASEIPHARLVKALRPDQAHLIDATLAAFRGFLPPNMT